MNDERIVSELNKIKGYIFIFVFVITLLFSGFKFLVYGFVYQLYIVDLFVILVSSIVLMLAFGIKNSEEYDERLEQKTGHIYKIGFSVLLIGGFWTHFFSVSIMPVGTVRLGYITNTLILVGFVVMLVLLKRKKLYANYKTIEEDSATYYKSVLRNISKLLIMFVCILGSILIVDYVFKIFVLNIYIFLLLVGISFVMISIEYAIFAAYEKNHYDEARLIEKNAPRYLTKNAVLFFSVIVVFQIVSAYVGLRYGLIVAEMQGPETLYPWSIYNELIQYLSVDFAILRLIMMLVIYFYVKNLTGHKIVMKMVLANALLSFTVSILGAIRYIIMPIILQRMESVEDIAALLSKLNYVDLGFSIVFIGFVAFVALNLYKYKIIYYKLTFVYVGMMIAFNPFIIIRVFKGDLKVYSIIVFITFIIKTLSLWVIYYLYSNKQFNLEEGLEKHITYDHKIK